MQHTAIKATIQTNIKLVCNDERVTTTSLQISDIFNKQHPHVIRGIEKIVSETDKSFSQSNFGLAKYTDTVQQ